MADKKEEVSKEDFELIMKNYEEFERFKNAKLLKEMWNGRKRNCDVYVKGHDALMAFMSANPKYSRNDMRMAYFTPFFAFVEWLWSPYDGNKVLEVKEILGE